MRSCACVYKCVCKCVHMCVLMYVFVYVNMYVCLCARDKKSESIFSNFITHTYVHLCGGERACVVCARVGMSLCVLVLMSVYTYVRVSACAYIRTHACFSEHAGTYLKYR